MNSVTYEGEMSVSLRPGPCWRTLLAGCLFLTLTARPLLVADEKDSPEDWRPISESLAERLSLYADEKPSRKQLRQLIAYLGKVEDSSEAADLLEQIGSPAVPYLCSALKSSKSWRIRENAATLLGNIKPTEQRAVHRLVDALRKDKKYQVRESAAGALRGMRPKPRSAIPGLLRALKEEQVADVRIQVSLALAEVADANVSTPALLRSLKYKSSLSLSRSWYSRGFRAWWAILTALGEVGPEAAPYLIKALRDEHPLVRAVAASSLGSVLSVDRVPTEEVRKAVPALTALLKDENATVREHAINGLKALAKDSSDVVPDLIEVLDDSNELVRSSAVVALGTIGLMNPASPTIPLLIEALKAESSNRRLGAVDALGWAGYRAAAAVPALVEMLKDEVYSIRCAAASSLGKIGKETEAARPALWEAVQQGGELGQTAAEALQRIASVSAWSRGN